MTVVKFREELAFLICLSAILLLAEAQGRKKTGSDQYSDSYEYDVDYGNPSDYAVVKPVDRRITCYACSYEETESQPHGMTNCNEPFNSFEVPQAICNGSCAMTHIWIQKPTDFIIVRDCRPICKESVTEKRYTRCCSTKLCNGFTSSIQQVKFSICLTFLLLIVALVNFEVLSYRN